MHDLANVQPCCVTLLYILRQTLSNQDVTLIAVQEHSAIQFGVQKPGKNSVKPTSQLWHLQLPFADSCELFGQWKVTQTARRHNPVRHNSTSSFQG